MYSDLINKELGIIDLLKSGWKIFQKNFLAILIIILLVNLPLSILPIIFEVALLSPVTTTSITELFSIFDGFFYLWTAMAVMLIVEKEILGNKIQAMAALKKALSYWVSAIGTSFYFQILFLVSLLLLIIPGIVFLVNSSFFLSAMSLRNQSWEASLAYSRNLVKGNFWKVLYTFLVVFIIVVIFPVYIGAFLIEPVVVWAGQGYSLDLLFNVVIVVMFVIDRLFFNLVLYLYVVTGTVFFLNMDYRKSLENK